MKKKTNPGLKIICLNRKASFNYFFEYIIEAGIVLRGSEIKSIRSGQVNISEAYCIISDNELWIKNMEIAKYKFCNDEDYNSLRLRKLLLNKTEIRKIKKQLEKKM